MKTNKKLKLWGLIFLSAIAGLGLYCYLESQKGPYRASEIRAEIKGFNFEKFKRENSLLDSVTEQEYINWKDEVKLLEIDDSMKRDCVEYGYTPTCGKTGEIIKKDNGLREFRSDMYGFSFSYFDENDDIIVSDNGQDINLLIKEPNSEFVEELVSIRLNFLQNNLTCGISNYSSLFNSSIFKKAFVGSSTVKSVKHKWTGIGKNSENLIFDFCVYETEMEGVRGVYVASMCDNYVSHIIIYSSFNNIYAKQVLDSFEFLK